MKFLKVSIISLSVTLIYILSSIAYPSWIKPGLVVVYQSEGGAGTGIGTTQGSSVYGTGYRIYLVLHMDKTGIYGLSFSMLGSAYSGVFYSSDLTQLGNIQTGSMFYVDPKKTDREITMRDAPPNCQIAGNPGTFVLECNIRGAVKKTAISYDRNTGLIKEFTVMEVIPGQGGRSSSVSKNRYITHFYISIPSITQLPPVALTSRMYRISSNAGLGPMVIGNLSVQYINHSGSIARYRVTMTGSPISMDAVGIPHMGPHYIHPALFNMKNFLQVPDANFQLVFSPTGSRGGIVLQHIWNGMIMLQQEFDPDTGLKLLEYHAQFSGGFPAIFELIQ